jgi:putative aldouronate transport system substrate-binding protein
MEVQEMKKLFYLAVAVLMCIVPLVGCQSTAPTPTATVAATVAPTEAATPVPTEAPKADGPFAKFDPGITVNLALDPGLDPKFPEGQDNTNNIWLSEYKSELGITVKYIWEAAGLEQYETKLNLAIASNDLPDIIHITNQSQMARLVDAGLATDLTDSFDKFASPLTKKAFEQDNGMAISQTTIEGKLWALPQGPAIMSGLEYTWIREDWRLKLGLPVPKTTEDILAMAEAFAKNDPDGNGKADTYGIVLGNQPYENYMNFRGFANNFGAYPTTWLLKDGKLVYGSIQPEMKSALSALATQYKDGAIDKEFVAKNAFTASSDAVAGKGGICFGQFWLGGWPLNDTYTADPTHYWLQYPIFDTTAGSTLKGTMGQTRVTQAYMVRKDFANPEALFKMFNLYNERLNGPLFDAAKYHTDPKTGNAIFMLSPIMANGATNKNVEQNINVTKAIDTKDVSVLTTAEQQATYKATKDYMDGVNKDTSHFLTYCSFYGPNSVFGIENTAITTNHFVLDQFYGADTPEMLRRMSILRSQEEQMILDIITGNKPVEYFDEFVKNWTNIGGETITFEVNQWYDKVKAK